MNVYVTAVAAALLVAGVARASDAEQVPAPAGEAVEGRDRVRDGGGEGTRDRDHDRVKDGTADPLRERARERMHEALAEHAPRMPPADPAAGAAMRDRERDRARDEMATRAAERHAKRAGTGEAGHRRGDDLAGPGSGHGGMRHGGECGDAAGQRRMTEMREGGGMGDRTMGDGMMDGR